MSSTFADLGVPADLVAVLSRRSIDQPFPIQTLTLPDALSGRDVSGRAPTGSGKTLAFGIAAIARLDRRPSRAGRPRVLVLVPTRELCAQVASELAPLASERALAVTPVYGGVSYGRQTRPLSQGAEVVVACPGRLTDLVGAGHVRLDGVEVVVVDEADRMADMGFLPTVGRLLDRTPSTRQTLLFSATLDGDVDSLVRRYQRDPIRHEVGAHEALAPVVEHLFWRTETAGRVALVASVVAMSGSTIVFCRTRRGADRVARQLVASDLRAAVIHGDRSQAQRERALGGFAAGRVDALVATDVAARGIHVQGVAVVIH
ncbi:MAG: DEAD/DEAH box helicase, partial [Acidimicrobiales bacterium]